MLLSLSVRKCGTQRIIDTTTVHWNYIAASPIVGMSSDDDRNHPRIIIEEYENGDLNADENLARRFYGSICEEIDQNTSNKVGERINSSCLMALILTKRYWCQFRNQWKNATVLD